jgi:hypothetical protein
MFKFIFLIQVFIYLVLAPYVVMDNKLFYYPPIYLGFVVIISITVGIYLKNMRHATVVKSNIVIERITPRHSLSWLIVFLSLLYIYTSYGNGLTNRRLGSEYMAELYANLPLFDLIILRSFEIMFTPFLAIYLLSSKNIDVSSKIRVFTSLIIAIPFMGLLDSRGRLLVILISILCFIEISQLMRILYKQIWIFILAVFAIFAFIFFSIQRLESYADYRDYLYTEVYLRLDGLNLLTQLNDRGLTLIWGQFDLNMFDPLISRIPFLEAAAIAKSEGRTSTKQYYLQDLLLTKNLDDSSSMINDPYYFGGLLGLFVAFAGLGYCMAIFDNFIKNKWLFTNRYTTALAFAFVSAFVMIETDFVGAFTTLAQTFIVVLGLLFVGCERKSFTVHAGQLITIKRAPIT